jgi:hypothetical protein
MDQMIWGPEGSADRGIGVFAVAMGLPGDRNLLIPAMLTWTHRAIGVVARHGHATPAFRS